MQKYGGQLIHQTEDEYGIIEVVDFPSTIRGLHFGSEHQQSSSLLSNPAILMQQYTQAMLTPLCWLKPQNCLALGMGGGCQINYLFKFVEGIKIDAVEMREEVVNVAEKYFMLDPLNNQLELFIDSAESYLTKNSHQYDLILMDLFLNSENKSFTLKEKPILQQLFNSLSSKGMLCFTFYGNDYTHYEGLLLLHNIFNKQCYLLEIDNNHQILFAFKTPPPAVENINFEVMEKQFGLPFKQFFSDMKLV